MVLLSILLSRNENDSHYSRKMRRWVWALVPVLLVLGACGGSGTEPDEGIRVVATTSILGDIVSNLVGSDVTVEVLMPVAVDPHDFQPSSKQVAAISRADLVVANGGGLEEGLRDALEAARDDGVRVLELTPLVDPIISNGREDPHFWLDPQRVVSAVDWIMKELVALGAEAPGFGSYADQLLQAHSDVEAILSAVQPSSRKLVTNHNSFAYFADRYGFEVIGVVIPGGSTLGDPSSEELAALVRVIEGEGVKALFAGASQPALLAETIADEVGHRVTVVELYAGSLGEPGSGAATLIEMLLLNARRIADALQG